MSNIAIIPARKGSKRIPLKNIKPFLGKPIMAYSIETALRCNLFDEVMVSTDDEEIANTAIKYGAKVPFLRSSKTADDFATTPDVLLEVISEYTRLETNFTKGCCIYATAPFISPEKLANAYQILIEQQFDSVFPVLKFSYPIQRALKIADGKASMINPEYVATRSQDLPPCYHDTGQFYWFDVEALRINRTLFTDNSGAMIISDMEAQDIDEPSDWQLAELKYRLLQS